MKTELQYRTFQDVVESATTDIPHLGLEGAVDPQQLLKVVVKINYQLGLKINANRVKLLEVVRGKARLPADFSVANYAMLCQGRHEVDQPETLVAERFLGQPNVHDGLLRQLDYAPNGDLVVDETLGQFTTTLRLQPGRNVVNHTLYATELVVQATTAQGGFSFFTVEYPSPTQVVLISEAETAVDNVHLILIGRKHNPLCQPACVELEDHKGNFLVRYRRENSTRNEEFRHVSPLRFVRSKGVSAECQNLFRHAQHQVSLQGGFLIAPVQDGHILLSYLSVLEDEQGRLLTLDHPKVNDYYEYAIKERVYENLWFAGEDVAQKLGYVQDKKLRPARTEALSFIKTPDFADFRQIWELNRQAQIQKYYTLFMHR